MEGQTFTLADCQSGTVIHIIFISESAHNVGTEKKGVGGGFGSVGDATVRQTEMF